MKANDILTPDVLTAAGWQNTTNGDGVSVFSLTKKQLIMFVALTAGRVSRFSMNFYDDPVNQQWLISRTFIYTLKGTKCTSKTEIKINLEYAITIQEFNSILESVRLSQFKIDLL